VIGRGGVSVSGGNRDSADEREKAKSQYVTKRVSPWTRECWERRKIKKCHGEVGTRRGGSEVFVRVSDGSEAKRKGG
jgi:hypothetical protein